MRKVLKGSSMYKLSLRCQLFCFGDVRPSTEIKTNLKHTKMAFVNYLKIGEKKSSNCSKRLHNFWKVRFFKKATKIWRNLQVDLRFHKVNVKSTGRFRQIFVAFLKNLTCNILFIWSNTKFWILFHKIYCLLWSTQELFSLENQKCHCKCQIQLFIL